MQKNGPPSEGLWNFSPVPNIETKFHQAMKQHFVGEPLLPLAAREAAHRDGLGLPRFKKLRNLGEILFAHSDGELVPMRSRRWDPAIRQNHWHATHPHGFEQPDGRGTDASRAQDKLAGLDQLRVASFVVQSLASNHRSIEDAVKLRGSILKKAASMSKRGKLPPNRGIPCRPHEAKQIRQVF